MHIDYSTPGKENLNYVQLIDREKNFTHGIVMIEQMLQRKDLSCHVTKTGNSKELDYFEVT